MILICKQIKNFFEKVNIEDYASEDRKQSFFKKTIQEDI